MEPDLPTQPLLQPRIPARTGEGRWSWEVSASGFFSQPQQQRGSCVGATADAPSQETHRETTHAGRSATLGPWEGHLPPRRSSHQKCHKEHQTPMGDASRTSLCPSNPCPNARGRRCAKGHVTGPALVRKTPLRRGKMAAHGGRAPGVPGSGEKEPPLASETLRRQAGCFSFTVSVTSLTSVVSEQEVSMRTLPQVGHSHPLAASPPEATSAPELGTARPWGLLFS